MASAHNYAWFFTFNWLNDKFNWRSTGEDYWPHDEFRRSSGANMTSADTNWECTTLVSSDDINDEIWPLPNCHQVDGDPMSVQCQYMNEPYKLWMTDHGYSASPTLFPSTPLFGPVVPLFGTAMPWTPTTTVEPSSTEYAVVDDSGVYI